MMVKPKPHVFLSHVRGDAERVQHLAADLEARGIETWVDRDKIMPGQLWPKAIEDAIRSGAFFVACFSQAYAARTSTHMNEELLIAIAEVRLRPAEASWFIPIKLNECEIPDRRIGPELTIRSFQWLDMFPDWAKSVDRLAEAIGPSPRPELLAPLSAFRDIDAPWCPELLVIPPGKFMMGYQEGPQHEVRLDYRVAVGRYPVTFEEYDRFGAETHGRLPNDKEWGFSRRAEWGRSRRPVIDVSWNDAKAYVAWLSQETGQSYRLLSEAEWEYAARAGTTTSFSWGDNLPTPEQANFGLNIGQATLVGTYPANPWGLYDMHGNVWEWVEDCWNESYQGAPSDGSAWTHGDCSRRVLRGGSWGDGAGSLRSARRGENILVGRYHVVGFRVARTLR